MVLKARVLGELCLTHDRAQPTKDAVGVGGDDHPLSVRRSEDVRRCDTLQPSPVRLPNLAKPVVLSNGAFEQREARLEERHVDDLALTATQPVPVVKRSHGPERGEHAGE
jgi:hypothetical protein